MVVEEDEDTLVGVVVVVEDTLVVEERRSFVVVGVGEGSNFVVVGEDNHVQGHYKQDGEQEQRMGQQVGGQGDYSKW